MHYAFTSVRKVKSFSCQWRIGERLSPFQVALGHASANAVKVTAGGWPIASHVFNFPHSILIHRALDEKAVGMIFMSIKDLLLKKSEHNKYNIYSQTIGILNAY